MQHLIFPLEWKNFFLRLNVLFIMSCQTLQEEMGLAKTSFM